MSLVPSESLTDNRRTQLPPSFTGREADGSTRLIVGKFLSIKGGNWRLSSVVYRNERSITDHVDVSPRDCFDLSILWPIDRLLGHDRYVPQEERRASLAVSRFFRNLSSSRSLQTNMHIFIYRVLRIGENLPRDGTRNVTYLETSCHLVADPSPLSLSLTLSLSHRESSDQCSVQRFALERVKPDASLLLQRYFAKYSRYAMPIL